MGLAEGQMLNESIRELFNETITSFAQEMDVYVEKYLWFISKEKRLEYEERLIIEALKETYEANKHNIPDRFIQEA